MEKKKKRSGSMLINDLLPNVRMSCAGRVERFGTIVGLICTSRY